MARKKAHARIQGKASGESVAKAKHTAKEAAQGFFGPFAQAEARHKKSKKKGAK